MFNIRLVIVTVCFLADFFLRIQAESSAAYRRIQDHRQSGDENTPAPEPFIIRDIDGNPANILLRFEFMPAQLQRFGFSRLRDRGIIDEPSRGRSRRQVFDYVIFYIRLF